MTTVALLGRPNAGKSTLFNALAKGQRALVHATPGTTRDIRKCPAKLDDLHFSLLDTAGLEQEKSGLAADISKLAEKAATQADLLIFLVDGASGPLPADKTLVRNLRKLGKPILLVLTKADMKKAQAHLSECLSFGLGEPIFLSAEHKLGMQDLYEALQPHIQSKPQPEENLAEIPTDDGEGAELEPADKLLEALPDRPIRIAILGQPNAGKSTLTNRLLGAEKMLTGPIPGLTREAISHPFRHGGHDFILTDTPGMRKKAKISDDLEQWSVGQAINAAHAADVAVLLIDASTYNPERGNWQVLEMQDAKIAQTLVTADRPFIVALSKWDAVSDKKQALIEAKASLRRTLTAIAEPVCLTLSAKTGQGVGALLTAAAELHLANYRQHATSYVNKALASALARRSPPLGRHHTAVSLKFARQTAVNPPQITLFGNRVNDLPNSYKQYLRNHLANQLQLQGLPLRLTFKSSDNPFKNKKESSE